MSPWLGTLPGGLLQVSPGGLAHFGTIPAITLLFLSRGCLQKSTFFGVLGEAGTQGRWKTL